MRTEHYIKELLYRYNCVVVPEFGAFLAHTASARIDSVSNTLHPPTKVISFNEQLSKNDGLLVSYISKAKKLSYEDLLEEVTSTSKGWKERLQNGETIDLHGVGELTMNSEHKVQFKPEEKVNYLASSFGLSAFTAAPIVREELKKEVEVLEESVPFIITPEKRNESSFRPWLKYAAVFLLFCAAGVSGYQLYNQNLEKQQLVRQDAQQQVSKYIQEATFFDTTPLELPPINLKIDKKEVLTGPQHHIIAGAFRIKQNADKKVKQLERLGYEAKYIGANKFGLHQVAYSSFSDSREALRFLRKIKNTVSRDAWMLSEK
ncbi:SPOR domain-containing protein [Croceitalea sp. MTPC9]|uniref:HU domain-containing protein n=1 Tax=unclassified Croceitalea TaxID=2632280 RepID=UPI002B3C2C2C|nr:SPOR domain-containing protein [Croceitalea sp. MTPC6]GMN16536.1 SPOR domain-containing protein [Croceitalea sp. MTPC9]